jgi:RNA polymerase sigma factor (sigma-70 family)
VSEVLRVESVTTREISQMGEKAADGDRQLLGRVASGDRDALAELYERFGSALFRYLLQITNERGVAEEVLQDTLVGVWKSAGTFEGRSSVQTWLFGIARRQAHNTLRRRVLPRADVEELEVLADSGPEPEDAALAEAEREEVAAAIRWLTPAHREVLTLAFVDCLSYGEIATIVGVPEGTIKSRLSNAKRNLRALLLDGKEARR